MDTPDAAPDTWIGTKRKHVASQAELFILDAITNQLTDGFESNDHPLDFSDLFRSLQNMSSYWTKKHVSQWIYNRGLHTLSSWNPKILRLCPETPPRLTSPPPLAWSTGQALEPDIALTISDRAVDPEHSMIKETEQLRVLDSSNFIHERIEETDRCRAARKITRCVIESMRPPYIYEGLLREDRELFKLVSEFVYGRLTAGFDTLVDELKAQHDE
jgi:hypothetical protein